MHPIKNIGIDEVLLSISWNQSVGIEACTVIIDVAIKQSHGQG